MRILLIFILLSIAQSACSDNKEDKKLELSNSLTISVPSEMIELEEQDTLPQYLAPLLDFDTKESIHLKGDGCQFSAIIINVQFESIAKQCKGYFENLSEIFSQTYPFREISASNTFKQDGYDYYYEVFKLDFSFASYSVFYAVSSVDGYLLYVNLWQETEDINKLEKDGLEILKSFKRS